jgi:hypothetical protein
MAEFLGVFAGAFGRGIAGPGGHILTHTGQDADIDADHARAQHGLPVFQHVGDARQNAVHRVDPGLLEALAHHRQHLGAAKGADQGGDEREAAGQIRVAIGEAFMGVDAILADQRHEEAQNAHDPAVQRV